MASGRGGFIRLPALETTVVTEPEQYSFERYLEAKRPLDDRARDDRVLDRFLTALAAADDPVHIVEVGAGTGALTDRALEWLPTSRVEYTVVETDPDLLSTAVDGIAERGSAVGEVREHAERSVVVDRPGGRFAAEFLAGDAFEVLADRPDEVDAVVGQAFVDLTDVRSTVETVFEALRPGGLAYFPITFDGVTALVPPVDPELDDHIERRYHRHMDESEKAGGDTGDSHAGRHLLTAVGAADGTVLAAGGSDWVVTPDDGAYPGDEAYLLHHIVDTVEGALADDDRVDDDRLSAWARERHDQVAAGGLTYVAHNLDVLARAPRQEAA